MKNAFSIYDVLKSNKIPDANIVLMIADDSACDARNVKKNKLYTANSPNLYKKGVEIDYRGSDVTPDAVTIASFALAIASLCALRLIAAITHWFFSTSTFYHNSIP